MSILRVQAEMVEGGTLNVQSISLSGNANIQGATIQSLQYNTVIPTTNYATLGAAITAAAPYGNTILVCSNIACTTNTTLPANVALDFMGNGIITLNTGVVLNVNGSIVASGTRIFTGNGVAAFDRAGKVNVVRPQWWGAVADGVTDDTTAFKRAVNTAMTVYASAGTYILQTVPIYANTRIYGDGDTTRFTVHPNYDLDNVSAGNTRVAIFDIKTANIHVNFDHALFDGNEANQTAVTPSLSIIRSYAMAPANTESLSLSIDNCTFVNQTHASILVKGKENANGRQLLSVTNSRFYDGRPGIGQDDPTSNNINGFAPHYIDVYDRCQLICTGNEFVYRKALANNAQYSTGAIRWTFSSAAVNADGASGIVENNYFYRCGRKEEYFDGTNTGNNGLAAIDFYARARYIIVKGNVFEHCYMGAIRGKVNADQVSIVGNTIANTPRSINVSTATYPNNRGYITVSGNIISNADVWGIGVLGNSNTTANMVYGVTIVGNVIDGVDNINGFITPSTSGIAAYYADDLVVADNSVRLASGGGCSGIVTYSCNRVAIRGNQISTANTIGIYTVLSHQAVIIDSNIIRGINDNAGIWVTGDVAVGASTLAQHSIRNNMVDTTYNYGIVFYVGGYISCVGNQVANVSGLSRGYYFSSNANGAIVSNFSGVGVTTPYFSTEDGLHTQNGNSWNPTVTYQTTEPTTGTWKVGDVAWNSAPAANTSMGWVCVTAGTPGTWKSFLTVSV
jgi:hypothetical protein